MLIDSLGGSLASGLSISAAFKQHGDVAVHFVGLNASAATIASLGAVHISIDAGAMYLVHQCSMAFLEWGSLNLAQFAALIAECHSKHRVWAVFTFGAELPKQRNLIVFDDFFTSGIAMISMKNILKPLGYNLVFFTRKICLVFQDNKRYIHKVFFPDFFTI